MLTRVRTGTAVPMYAKRCFSYAYPRRAQAAPRSESARPNGAARKTARSSSTHATPRRGYAAATHSTTAPPPRLEAPSYLYRTFMGHSSRFAAMNPPLTRTDITRLEREPLAHVAPGRVNDHVCIGMVKTLRWVADRVFRERYLHRATMLVTVASAAPSAGSVAAYLRMFFKRRPTNTDGNSSVSKLASVSAEMASPFLAAEKGAQTTPSSSPSASSSSSAVAGHASGGRLHHSTPNSSVSGAPLRHSYVNELRGLLAQSECHAMHYQILGSMAEITAVEQALVLLLQAFHFALYFVLFLFYPRMGFRLMAYTAEESSVVWTQMVNDVDLGKIAELRVPTLALHYWGLEGVFTAQGALVPMIVPPKVQDVILFRTEEKGKAAEVGYSDAAEGVKSAKPPALKAEGDAVGQLDTPSPSKTAGGGPSGAASESELPKSPATETTAGASTATDSTAAEEKEEAAEPLLHHPVLTDPSETVFTLRDVVLLIRSDEMVFRDLNHEMANELDTQPGFLRRLVDRFEQR
ncbi:putative mitochondrial alternative oxidase [Leptomonas pyrrhocoris]|uniref:Alternative oxidase n=1 Tax=Leptomonas pyrrhocoris TaxID=157538 RepID=A0A0M9G3I0_LEPPY|nr:putative mitochondrial alternative oxidase [Leptomonas pyrrhocoris]KPA81487.1 putative mitochondrial alternative oxidase [Leptomonas pyrrhocoris]|eukprot:XP_015659926.1 putative mitochondrial alternative oxidase [Leptomonas pyrrhocoris]